ncbi:SUMO deconjugating cysteine peptidase Ulp2 [Schizosaccharomyces pombe]
MRDSKDALDDKSGSFTSLLPPFGKQRGTSPNDAIPIKSPLERLANSVTSPEKPTVRTAIQKDSPRRKQIDDDQTPPKHLKRSFQNVTVVSPRKKKTIDVVELPFTKGGYGGFYDPRPGCLKFTTHEINVSYTDTSIPVIHIPVQLLKRCCWLQGWRDNLVESPVHAIHLTLKNRDMKRITIGDSASLLFLYNPLHVESARAGLDLLDQSDFSLTSPSSAKEFKQLLTLKQSTIIPRTPQKTVRSIVKQTSSPHSSKMPKHSLPSSPTPFNSNSGDSLLSRIKNSNQSSSERPTANNGAQEQNQSSSSAGNTSNDFSTLCSQGSDKTLLSDASCTTILVYPFSGTNSIAITNTDLTRLNEGEFLNDTIVDFYLRYLYCKLQTQNPSLANDTHIFNTFFYNRLTSKDKDGKRLGHRGVRKWTQKVDLFHKKYIIVPINETFHWYLAIICNIDRLMPVDTKLEEQDEIVMSSVEQPSASKTRQAELTSNSPAILIFDSLANLHKGALNYLREYLLEEAFERKNVHLKSTDIRGFHAKVPQQSNFSDCGIYALHFVELFLETPEQVIANTLDKSLRRTDAKNFDQQWNLQKINTMRRDLKGLIRRLSTEWSSNNERQSLSSGSNDEEDKENDDDLAILPITN